MNRVVKLGRFLKAWLLGSLGCLSVLGAVVTSGWTYRLCHRRIMQHWCGELGLLDKQISPRWCLSEQPIEGSFWQRIKWLFSSLKINFLVGLKHAGAAMMVTVLPGMMLAFAWWGGWNNSFHKGYEQAGVGPGLGATAILLVALILLYLPMAQSHLAVHGKLKAFFDIRMVSKLISTSPWGNLLLAVLTTLSGLPFIASALYLSTAAASKPEILDMPPVEIVAFLNFYYFLWAFLYVFPAFFIQRLVASRIYAKASWSLAKTGIYKHPELPEGMEIMPPKITSKKRKWLRRGWKSLVLSAAYASLVMFAFLPLMAQFSAAVPVKRWMVHPMVQLPLHRHIPKPLKQAADSRFARDEGGFISWLDDQD